MAETDELETTYGPPPTATPDIGGANIRMDVVGAGAPVGRVRRASATIPSVETAGSLLPPEAGPPVSPAPPPEDSGPLIDVWDPLMGELDATEQGFADNDEAQRNLLQQLRDEQAAATQRARAQMEYGYQRYADAGQEVMDLAEQQRLRRPPPPTPPVEPPVPEQRIRLFGEGPDNETGMQALNRITMTLGVMAQMGMGMKSGNTRGAMAAFSGAMKGWAEGNQIAGNQQWREYLANVQKLDREWARNREAFNDILKTDAIDLDRAKLKMAIRQTELGYGKELVGLTFRDLDQRLKMFNVERDMLQDNMKNAMQVMTLRMKNDIERRKELDLARWRTEQVLRWEQDRLSKEKMLGQTLGSRETIETADRASREGIAARNIASREKIAAERPGAAGGQQAQQNIANVAMVRGAVNTLKDLTTSKEKAAVIDRYLGPYDQYRAEGQRRAPYAAMGEVPPEAVDLEQNVALMNNYMVFLLSGKATTGPEAVRIAKQQPKMSSRLPVFKQELANTEKNIEILERDLIKKAKAGDPLARQIAEQAELIPKQSVSGAAMAAGGDRVIQVRGADGRVRPYQLDPGETGPPKGYTLVQ